MESPDSIAGKLVLVTGGSGFIGTHLCRRLIASGAMLHVVSRESRRSEFEHLQWHQADCRDMDAVRQVLKTVKPDLVFHLAGHVVGARDAREVLPTFYNNLASTVHILTAAAETGCERIIIAGSSEEPQILGSTTFACSPYAAAKWASSTYGRMFHELFEQPVVMPRIFMTYGPHQNERKLVPYVVCQLLRGKTPKLTSGRRLADWIYVDDVVEGLLRAATTPGIEGCAFDLGTGSLVSVREVVEQIAEIVDSSIEPSFGALPDRPFEQEKAADTKFLRNDLRYQPITSLQHGLETTIAWYRQQLAVRRDSSA